MAILGLLLGVTLVTVIRALQGLDPVQDPGVSLVLGGFMAAGFFMWGLGAFDPRMSEHAHDAAHAEQLALALAEEEAQASPGAILGSYIWLLLTGLLLLLLAIAAFALAPGSPTLTTTSQPLGNTAANGFVEMQILGQTLVVSQLLLLVGFVAVVFVSLAVAAGAFGFVLFILNRGMTEVAAVPATALGPGPLAAAEPAPAGDGPLAGALVRAVGLILAVLAAVVVLDLLLPFDPAQRVPSLSYVLAVFTLLTIFTLAAWGLLGALLRRLRGWLWLARALIVLVVVIAFVALYVALVTGSLLALSLLPLTIVNATLLVALALMAQARGVLFAALSTALFVLFYYVLIGLVLVGAPDTLFWLSLINAALIALVVLRPRQVTDAVGGGARGLARWLRRLPFWLNG